MNRITVDEGILTLFRDNGNWWPIYRIRFTPEQMRFLILNLGMLQEGRYPPEPGVESGYIDSRIRLPNYREPAQNRVLELAAEVECRLDLVMNYISGWPRPTKRIRKTRK